MRHRTKTTTQPDPKKKAKTQNKNLLPMNPERESQSKRRLEARDSWQRISVLQKNISK